MKNLGPLILLPLFVLVFITVGAIKLIREHKNNTKEIQSLKVEIHELKYPSKLLLLPDEIIEGPGRDN